MIQVFFSTEEDCVCARATQAISVARCSRRFCQFWKRARKKTRPREVDLYEVFCGVTYVLKSGCQWRMLPREFPKWRTCYSYFQQWSELQESGISFLEDA